MELQGLHDRPHRHLHCGAGAEQGDSSDDWGGGGQGSGPSSLKGDQIVTVSFAGVLCWPKNTRVSLAFDLVATYACPWISGCYNINYVNDLVAGRLTGLIGEQKRVPCETEKDN